MLEQQPLHDDGALADDAELEAFDAFYLDVAGDDLEGDAAEQLDERESVLARLERMADPASSSITLERIPPRLWKQTLAPFRRQQRMWIARQVRDQALKELAIELASELDMAEGDAADARARATHVALRTGHPLPSPGPVHAAAGASVQVNIRLRRDDHERLAHAASAVGLKPTTLARSLVLNGAAMILREHGTEHLAPPTRPIHRPLAAD
jgi:hypothetical protein